MHDVLVIGAGHAGCEAAAAAARRGARVGLLTFRREDAGQGLFVGGCDVRPNAAGRCIVGQPGEERAQFGVAPCRRLPVNMQVRRAHGVQGASLSLDSTDPARHDRFRHLPGAWQGAVRATEALRAEGLDFSRDGKSVAYVSDPDATLWRSTATSRSRWMAQVERSASSASTWRRTWAS